MVSRERERGKNKVQFSLQFFLNFPFLFSFPKFQTEPKRKTSAKNRILVHELRKKGHHTIGNKEQNKVNKPDLSKRGNKTKRSDMYKSYKSTDSVNNNTIQKKKHQIFAIKPKKYEQSNHKILKDTENF